MPRPRSSASINLSSSMKLPRTHARAVLDTSQTSMASASCCIVPAVVTARERSGVSWLSARVAGVGGGSSMGLVDRSLLKVECRRQRLKGKTASCRTFSSKGIAVRAGKGMENERVLADPVMVQERGPGQGSGAEWQKGKVGEAEGGNLSRNGCLNRHTSPALGFSASCTLQLQSWR